MRRFDRTSSAILLSTGVVLIAAAALFPLARTWVTSFPGLDFSRWGIAIPFRGHHRTLRARVNPVTRQMSVLFSEIDIPSGRMQDTGVALPFPAHGLVAGDKTAWIVSQNLVIETDGTNHTEHHPARGFVGPVGQAFLYQSRPAIVDLDDAGLKYRLFAFEDGEWQDRGEVGVPGVGRKWVRNELTGNIELQPGVKSQPSSIIHHLTVVTAGDVNHLFYFDSLAFVVAYREGFDFIQGDGDIASAIEPENVAADTMGWTKLDMVQGLCDFALYRDKLVVCNQSGQSKPIQFLEKPLVPRDSPFRPVMELKTDRWESLGLIEDPQNDRLYFIRDRWLHPKLYLYQGDQLDPMPPMESELTRMTMWGLRIAGQVVGVLILCQSILIAGAEWLGRGQETRFEFGAQVRALAPFWRRSLARLIDIMLILAWPAIQVIRLGPIQLASDVYEAFDTSASPLDSATVHAFGQSAAWISFVYLVLICIGSPGKRICGVQVLRTTLRPCGISKTLLRELLFFLDAPGLIFPGIMAMLITERRQRLGDLMADTVVVCRKTRPN